MNPPESMTDLDRKILLGLYHYKALAASQIKQLYFEDQNDITILKLHLLRKGGYAEAKPGVRYDPPSQKVRKLASVYYVTEKGLDWLSRYREDVGRSVAANEGRVRQMHRVGANKILLQLQEVGGRGAREKLSKNLVSRRRLLSTVRFVGTASMSVSICSIRSIANPISQDWQPKCQPNRIEMVSHSLYFTLPYPRLGNH
jgi:hypothetical protein